MDDSNNNPYTTLEEDFASELKGKGLKENSTLEDLISQHRSDAKTAATMETLVSLSDDAHIGQLAQLIPHLNGCTKTDVNICECFLERFETIDRIISKLVWNK